MHIRRLRLSILLLLIVAVAMTLVRAGEASAHANLVESDPPAQSILARAPTRVQMIFSEKPDPASMEVAVTDGKRNRVDQNDAKVQPGQDTTITISLKDSLQTGVYTVEWKMVSAVDGHLTRGLIPFTVGDPGAVPESAAVTEAGQSSASGGLPGVIARWLSVLAAVALTGGFIFVPAMFVPALRMLDRSSRGKNDDADFVSAETVNEVADRAATRALSIFWIVLGVFALSALALLIVEMATTADVGIDRALGFSYWSGLPQRRRVLWVARGLLLLPIAAVLALLARVRGRAARGGSSDAGGRYPAPPDGR